MERMLHLGPLVLPWALLIMLAGWQLGRLLGVDITTASGFSAHTLLGWGLLLAGLGAGKWASLRWRARRSSKP